MLYFIKLLIKYDTKDFFTFSLVIDSCLLDDTSVQKMDTNENDDGRGCLFGSILSDIEELKNLERKKLSNGDEIEDYEFDSVSQL